MAVFLYKLGFCQYQMLYYLVLWVNFMPFPRLSASEGKDFLILGATNYTFAETEVSGKKIIRIHEKLFGC